MVEERRTMKQVFDEIQWEVHRFQARQAWSLWGFRDPNKRTLVDNLRRRDMESRAYGFRGLTANQIKSIESSLGESVAGRFNNLSQTSSVADYQERFQVLKPWLVSRYGELTEAFFLEKFINGLKVEIRYNVEMGSPTNLSYATDLARYVETTLEFITANNSSTFKHHTNFPSNVYLNHSSNQHSAPPHNPYINPNPNPQFSTKNELWETTSRSYQSQITTLIEHQYYAMEKNYEICSHAKACTDTTISEMFEPTITSLSHVISLMEVESCHIDNGKKDFHNEEVQKDGGMGGQLAVDGGVGAIDKKSMVVELHEASDGDGVDSGNDNVGNGVTNNEDHNIISSILSPAIDDGVSFDILDQKVVGV